MKVGDTVTYCVKADNHQQTSEITMNLNKDSSVKVLAVHPADIIYMQHYSCSRLEYFVNQRMNSYPKSQLPIYVVNIIVK